MEKEFEIGDSVKVVKYGSLMWTSRNSNYKLPCPIVSITNHLIFYDRSPDLVGQNGIIREISHTGQSVKYALEGVRGKTAWYDKEQLEFNKLKL